MMNIVIAKCVAASKGSSPPFWLVLKIWMLSDPFCQYPFGDLRSGDAKFRDDPSKSIYTNEVRSSHRKDPQPRVF